MIGPPSDSHAGTDAAARRELVLCLHFCSGVGSVLGRRVAQAVRSVDDLHAGGTDLLRGLPGIGSHRARAVVQSIAAARARIEAEHALARDQGAALIAWGDADYPPLLAELPDAPLALFVRGRLTPTDDRGQRRAFGVAMVGSRRATAYGIEQTERFAAALAGAGLDIISGGARGIDAAAHRAALRAGGRTIAVMGCGLARCYPPEHASLYDEIVERGGAVVSELPMNTEPHARHFPERNRIISGLSLGVLVMEAPRASGALITARLAVEQHGREVMALPGRVDSPASEGCLELIKQGGAAMVTSPADVIDALELPARHVHQGTHAARFSGVDQPLLDGIQPSPANGVAAPVAEPAPVVVDLTDRQRLIVEALAEPRSIESLSRAVELALPQLQAELTMLELKRVIQRDGSVVRRRTLNTR